MESGWKAAIRNCRDRKVFTLTQNLAGGRTEPFTRTAYDTVTLALPDLAQTAAP